MAVDLSKLVSKRKLSLDELNNKTIAVDAYNVLYQFLSIIRGPDGSPLSDSHGNVTSHLSGIFYRNIELMEHGAKPIYIFDGIPSILKQRTIQARMKRRDEASAMWKEAMEKGETEAAKGYAQASTRITKDIVASARELLTLMGIPFISAPSEGEAQASIMCKNGLVDAVGSQDYDTMLFGAPQVFRNLTISGKRKLPRKNIYINVEPEVVNFNDTLSSLGLTQKQLIWLGIMLGTDFNDGIKGVGPKTALKIAKGAKSIDEIKQYAKEKTGSEFELDISEVEALFLNPEVKQISESELKTITKTQPDKEGLIKFMCDTHEFSNERIEKYADKLIGRQNSSKQRGLGSFTE